MGALCSLHNHILYVALTDSQDEMDAMLPIDASSSSSSHSDRRIGLLSTPSSSRESGTAQSIALFLCESAILVKKRHEKNLLRKCYSIPIDGTIE